MLYILALTLGFLITYPLLGYFFQYFFLGKIDGFKYSLWHIFWTFSFLSIILTLVLLIPDEEMGNRLQHAFGGGFTMVMLSYFSLQAAGVSIRRFQFFVLSLMIASCFGIANELLESIMQLGLTSTHIFATNIADTWYDLWANSIGALFGVPLFTYLLGQKH